MKLNQILNVSAFALIGFCAPMAAMASVNADAVTGNLTIVKVETTLPTGGFELSRRGRGADDGPGHVRGKGRGRGADDARTGMTTVADPFMMASGGGDDHGRGRGRGSDDSDGDRGRGRGSDDNGGDRGRGRGSDDGAGHRSGDHNSRDHRSGTTESGSGRSRPRVPGGSGCDSAGDVAEHGGCS